MPRFLDPVNALAYQYNGTPGYLMSQDEYAAFLSLIYDTDAANVVEMSEVLLMPNEEGVLSYTIPADRRGTLLSVKVDADGYCEAGLRLNDELINSERNSHARPALKMTERFEVSSGDTLTVSIRNDSIRGKTNAYKIYIYLTLKQI